jgi:hypothetical protein
MPVSAATMKNASKRVPAASWKKRESSSRVVFSLVGW